MGELYNRQLNDYMIGSILIIIHNKISYVNVFADHYANVSPSQYGLLNMILPFITILAKIFFCSLADRHRAYRTYFVYFLISSLIGYGSFAILPSFVQAPAKESGLNHRTWIIICIMTSIATISMSVVACLSDTFAMSSAIKTKSSYGYIRVWGTIGWGLGSFVLTIINQYKKLPFLVPGLIMTVLLLASDALLAIFWRNDDDFELTQDDPSGTKRDCDLQAIQAPLQSRNGRDKQDQTSSSASSSSDLKNMDTSDVRLQWFLFKEIVRRRPSLYRYMTIFTISGALASVQWSYFFLFLEKIFTSNFEYISGLSMIGQSMLGELPFFILSDLIVRRLGRSYTLSLSIMSIGLRYILYEFLVPHNMYFVMLTESLQGPSFGLFYVIMTEVGLEYSNCEGAITKVVEEGMIRNQPEEVQKLRQALRATMQSLMSACYEGLGMGIGSILGGLIIEYYGFRALWISLASIAFILGLLNLLIETFRLPILVDKDVNSTTKLTSREA